jgi:hypothetical protein
MLEDALQLIQNGHLDKPSLLNNLSSSLLSRYQRFGDLTDIQRSILMRTEAVQLAPDGHPDKPSWLNNLGVSLLTRYNRLGELVDVEKAISMFEDAM